VRESLFAQRQRAEDVRRRLAEAREKRWSRRGPRARVARKGAQLEGDAEGPDAQAAELTRRIERSAPSSRKPRAS
jgi:hypothetical protein